MIRSRASSCWFTSSSSSSSSLTAKTTGINSTLIINKIKKMIIIFILVSLWCHERLLLSRRARLVMTWWCSRARGLSLDPDARSRGRKRRGEERSAFTLPHLCRGGCDLMKRVHVLRKSLHTHTAIIFMTSDGDTHTHASCYRLFTLKLLNIK